MDPGPPPLRYVARDDAMRVLYLYCHPLPESFHTSIRAEALAGLKEAGHAVDLCDLYAEKFDPVMSEQERRDYHDMAKNQSRVAGYVRRLRAADALVIQFPVWRSEERRVGKECRSRWSPY